MYGAESDIDRLDRRVPRPARYQDLVDLDEVKHEETQCVGEGRERDGAQYHTSVDDG